LKNRDFADFLDISQSLWEFCQRENKNPNRPKSSHYVRELPSGNGRGIFNVSDTQFDDCELIQTTQPPQAVGYQKQIKK